MFTLKPIKNIQIQGKRYVAFKLYLFWTKYNKLVLFISFSYKKCSQIDCFCSASQGDGCIINKK